MNLGVALGDYLKSLGNGYIFLFLNFKFQSVGDDM